MDSKKLNLAEVVTQLTECINQAEEIIKKHSMENYLMEEVAKLKEVKVVIKNTIDLFIAYNQCHNCKMAWQNRELDNMGKGWCFLHLGYQENCKDFHLHIKEV